MKTAPLIRLLKDNPGREVLAWDPNEGKWLPVTGMVITNKTIKLYTDDLS